MDSVHDIWRRSYEAPALKAGDVHVWRVYLDRDSFYVRKLFGTLSSDERQKAESYHVDQDSNRFVVARGMLRKILGSYLSLSPNRISFSYDRYGKPFLDSADNSFRFNVAHSQERALIAVARGREVGVDVEFVDKKVEIFKIAQRIFSPTELSRLQILAFDLQATAFFRGWTRKEAYLKAVGTGFSEPKKQLAGPVMPAELFISDRTTGFEKLGDWTLTTLPFEQKYMAALAVEGEIGTIGYHQMVTE